MFSKDKSKAPDSDVKQPNIIGAGTRMNGDVETNGDLRVDGVIEGNIKSKGKVVIGAGGVIKGTIKCVVAEIAGTFEGKMEVSDLLSLKSTARFAGEMSVDKLSIEPGAKFTGTCSMPEAKPAPASAPAEKK